jgi:hypothetical protein
MLLRRLVAVGLCAIAVRAHAVPPLVVQAVVSPAWIDRADGIREPLAVDATIERNERVVTGSGARALLRMPEGSMVKLGENAQFKVDALDMTAAADGNRTLWQGSLDVLRGAFRYTTAVAELVRGQRDLKIHVNSIVAGIRGTDVWGKTEPGRDFVVLIEGRISVTHPGGEATLAQPRSMLVAPRGAATLPVRRITEDELAPLAAETEIFSGAGGARSDGHSRVLVIETVDETYARSEQARLRKAGYPAQLVTVERMDEPFFEVALTHLGGERDARAMAQRLHALGYAKARPAR